MKFSERRYRILGELAIKSVVKAEEIVKKLKASRTSIDSDLNHITNLLSFLGVERLAGGIRITPAMRVLKDTYFYRNLRRNRAEKIAIASYIVEELLEEKDIIALGPGTTVGCVAEEIIAQEKKVEAVITNNLYVFSFLGLSGVYIHPLPAGTTFEPQTQAFHGGRIIETFREPYPTKKILSPATVSRDGELMLERNEEVAVVKELLKASEKCQVVIAFDRSKIGKSAAEKIANLEDLKPEDKYTVVTNKKLSPDQEGVLKKFQERGISVRKAPSKRIL